VLAARSHEAHGQIETSLLPSCQVVGNAGGAYTVVTGYAVRETNFVADYGCTSHSRPHGGSAQGQALPVKPKAERWFVASSFHA